MAAHGPGSATDKSMNLLSWVGHHSLGTSCPFCALLPKIQTWEPNKSVMQTEIAAIQPGARMDPDPRTEEAGEPLRGTRGS